MRAEHKLKFKKQAAITSDELAQFQALQRELIDARRRSSEQQEYLMRRLGAELHDGPAQLLGLALLRIDMLLPVDDEGSTGENIQKKDVLRTILQDALKELRNLATGLSMPELADLSLTKTARLAIRNHERMTDTNVRLKFDRELPECTPLPFKVTVYRIIQEGLSNAYRHAKAAKQAVALSYSGDSVVLTVTDAGPGFRYSNETTLSTRLGISGMRDRLACIGGTLMIQSQPDHGTRLVATLPLKCNKCEDD